ncbi:MAG TPA: matrixin family metalloprotease, partial [Candidatus Saccharimonadales bacterium]|nr:matrixin family metalloprotease [Candidatus Saccharimonadales bacterium]
MCLPKLRALPLALLLALLWIPAAAYIRIATSSTDATPVKWDLDETTLQLPNVAGGEVIYQINSAGSDNIGDSSEFDAVDAAFRHWEAILNSRIAFARGPDSSLLEASDDGINLVYWAEGTKTTVLGDKRFPVTGFVGMTVIVNDTTGPAAGLIRNADIVLNGNELTWTTDPASDPNAFDVETVVTHEAGHVLGLEHSPVMGATMYSRLSAGTVSQISLADDDIYGACAIYPDGDQLLVGAEQYGRVQTGVGGKVLGAVVNTYDSNGILLSGTISDPNGDYSSAGIPAGNHSTYVQPLDNPAASYSTLFDETDLGGPWNSSVDTSFIPTNPTPVSLTAGSSTIQNFVVGTTAPAVHISAVGQRALTPGAVSFSTRPALLFTGDSSVYIGVSGPGMVSSVVFEVLGTGVTVNGLAATGSANGEPAVVYDVSVDPNAVPGTRSIRVQTAGQRVYATGAVEVLKDPVITNGIVGLPSTVPAEINPGTMGDPGLSIAVEGNGVRLTWTADPQATEYDVYRGNLPVLFGSNGYDYTALPSPNGTCGILDSTYLFAGD